MIFTSTVPMADVIHENYLLLPILNRFGIRLGFGSKSIHEVCSSYDINTHFFLEVINAYNTKEFFPDSSLQTFSIQLIVDYLQNTHDYFIRVKIPQIGKQIDNLLETTSPENKDKVVLIKQFFEEYRIELSAHTLQEDDDVYPYAIAVEKEFLKDVPDSAFVERITKESIITYAQEHGNVDEKLYDLKNIIIKYLPPLKDCNLQNSILYELFNFENEMKSHVTFEDKVLVPKVLQMEKVLVDKLNKN